MYGLILSVGSRAVSVCPGLWPTSKRPGALPAPPENKYPHPKGKADFVTWPTSYCPGALHPPPPNKSSHPKGKAGPDHVANAKLCPGAHPSPLRMSIRLCEYRVLRRIKDKMWNRTRTWLFVLVREEEEKGASVRFFCCFLFFRG